MTHQPIAMPDSRAELPAMFTRYQSWVERELTRAVPSSSSSGLHVPLQYHLGWVDQAGAKAASPVSQGKALRPTLCLFASEALSGSIEKASQAAAALELIHNFSLIHDDIQDQDQERRHQPTVWFIWGVPKALAAGNFLQSIGDLALLSAAKESVLPEAVLMASQILTASCLEMIEGQCQDLAFEARTDITTEEYLDMIACKTGSLIRSGLEIGARLASGDPLATQAFVSFGNNLGRTFQIRDDFLGIWGDEDTTGKAAGNDILRRKKSFPVVFALDRAKGPALDELLRIYSQQELDGQDVERVLEVLDDMGAKEESQRITETSAEEALRSLAAVGLPAWAKHEAEALVDFLARREF